MRRAAGRLLSPPTPAVGRRAVRCRTESQQRLDSCRASDIGSAVEANFTRICWESEPAAGGQPAFKLNVSGRDETTFKLNRAVNDGDQS
jgi:hypothetical protein